MLCLAEILRLQDPASVQLEMVNLARAFPDLRYVRQSELVEVNGHWYRRKDNTLIE